MIGGNHKPPPAPPPTPGRLPCREWPPAPTEWRVLLRQAQHLLEQAESKRDKDHAFLLVAAAEATLSMAKDKMK